MLYVVVVDVQRAVFDVSVLGLLAVPAVIVGLGSANTVNDRFLLVQILRLLAATYALAALAAVGLAEVLAPWPAPGGKA